jgi:hypothetical protein
MITKNFPTIHIVSIISGHESMARTMMVSIRNQ